MAANGTTKRGKGYFTYAELLFTLCAVMWCSALTADPSMQRSMQLVLLGLVGVGGFAGAVVKARLRAKELPKAWIGAVVYCVLAFLVAFLLTHFFAGVAHAFIFGLILWGMYQNLMFGSYAQRR